MILKKWNYKIHRYENYWIPNDFNCKTFSRDMNEEINCPHCGNKVKFGECYTSKEIHTDIGFGYAVCEKCHEKEWKKKKESKLCQERQT